VTHSSRNVSTRTSLTTEHITAAECLMITFHFCREVRTSLRQKVEMLNIADNKYLYSNGCLQAWARGGTCPPPSGNVIKCFCALLVAVKRSVDKLFMHYFHNLRRLLGALPPDRHRGSIPGPCWGTFVPRPLICPPLEKILRVPMFILWYLVSDKINMP